MIITKMTTMTLTSVVPVIAAEGQRGAGDGGAVGLPVPEVPAARAPPGRGAAGFHQGDRAGHPGAEDEAGRQPGSPQDQSLRPQHRVPAPGQRAPQEQRPAAHARLRLGQHPQDTVSAAGGGVGGYGVEGGGGGRGGGQEGEEEGREV